MNCLKPNFNLGIYGKSKSGKTHLIKYIINSIYLQFDCIIVISPTSFNGSYDYVKKLSGISTKLLSSSNLDDKLRLILRTQKNNKQNDIDNRILLIFDDIQGLFGYSKIIRQLNAGYRHYNVSLILSFQSITGCKSEYRINHQYVILFKMRSILEFKNCKESFLDDIGSLNDVKLYLNDGFNEPYKFLFVNRDLGDKYFAICPKTA